MIYGESEKECERTGKRNKGAKEGKKNKKKKKEKRHIVLKASS